MTHVRIYGFNLYDAYARKLIRGLTGIGTPVAIATAKQISGGLDRGESAGPLTPEMRDAILAVLANTPPRPGTAHLQRALLQDQQARASEALPPAERA